MSNIRRADPDEEAWVNKCYDEIGFVPSDFAREFVAVAVHEGARAALGRLAPVETDCAELGGIYVLPAFRGLGLASQMVSYLLHQGAAYRKIYCLPFEHLVQLYVRAGFRPCVAEDVPRAIGAKHRWCNSHYPRPTLLLVRP